MNPDRRTHALLCELWPKVEWKHSTPPNEGRHARIATLFRASVGLVGEVVVFRQVGREIWHVNLMNLAIHGEDLRRIIIEAREQAEAFVQRYGATNPSDVLALLQHLWPRPKWVPDSEDPSAFHASVGLAGYVDVCPDPEGWRVSVEQVGLEETGAELDALIVFVRDNLAVRAQRTADLCQGPSSSGPQGRNLSLVFPPPVGAA